MNEQPLTKSEIMAALFAEYGDDAEGGLAAMANVAPQLWHEYTDKANVKSWKQDYRSWVRRSTYELPVKQEPSLFPEQENNTKTVRIRSKLVVNQAGKRKELDVMAITVNDMESVLAAVERDERAARTMLERAAMVRELVAAAQAKTEELGRPVSIAEVVQLRRAS